MGTDARSEKWKRVEELFQAAQRHPADQRAEFLQQACPDDPELCVEVESLLRAAASRDPLLDGSPLSSIAERAPALKAGDKLGNFEIVALIGRGGMGEVYRARDLRLRREVAIKTLPPGFAGDRDRIARFEREARAASALNHPNIVSVHDIGQDGTVSYIVSELVDGETLALVIQRGPLSVKKLIEVGTQICDGLAAAHAAGVVHRDLKPGNIMLTRDGRVKILDFGLARQERAPGADSTTIEVSHPGMVMGTPGYMSPEQVRGEPTDARSDIFSLGVILYEMAAGKPAFTGKSSVEVMNSILKDDPLELPPASPPELDRIVRRCIEKQASRRFQGAADLGFALQSISSAGTRRRPPKRWANLKWAIPLAACVAVGAAHWLGVRLPNRSSPPENILRRLTNDTCITSMADISPDGRLVAFNSNRVNPDVVDIWVQQVDGSGSIRITNGPEDNWDPSFSPDGSQIAFRSERDRGGIYITSALGGEARELIPEGRRPRFSPDGHWLSFWTGSELSEMNGNWRRTKLFVQSLSGGPAMQIAAACGVSQVTPVWSPDSSRLLFRAACGTEVLTPWVYTIDTRELRPSNDLPVQHAAIEQWVAGPSRLIVRETVGDATYLTAVPVSRDGIKLTGASQRLTSVTDYIARASSALDGRMVLSLGSVADHIWGLPIDRNGRAVGEPKQITHGPAGEVAPALSRDGGKVAFVSARANHGRVFYRDLATGQEKELSTDGGSFGSPVFNPEGSGIMCQHFFSTSSNRNSLDYLPISGGIPKKIWDRSAGSALWDWSPDGKTLLISTSDDLTKPWRGTVKQLDLESLGTVMLLEDPELHTWQAHFSHDGRWVTFNLTDSDGTSSRIFIAPFHKGPLPRDTWIPIPHSNWDDKPRFSFNDKLLIFLSGQVNTPHRLWAQKLGSDMRPDGKPAAIFPSDEKSPLTMDFDEISVGPRLIVFVKPELSSNLWLLEPAKGGTK